MSERTGGDVVIETLTALGARYVFGIPGQHALGLFDALRRSPLTFVSSRVENNSAFGADGYSRVTGEVGVLFLSTGPGALTALGALQEAHATGVPIIVVASQVPRRGLGGTRNGLLHQLDNQQASARNVTKSTALVRNAAHLPVALTDAWALAKAAPSGPTWVEVSEDVLLGPAGGPPVLCAPAAGLPSREPLAELVGEATDLLSTARRPVILAGGGVRRSPGGPESLRRLAEALDAPVIATAGGKGAIDFAHPLSAASWIEDGQTTELLERADVLLAVGTAIGEVTSNYFTFAPRGRLIQVDADPRVLGSNYSSLGIAADAALALGAMADALGAHDHAKTVERAGARVAAELRSGVEARLATQDREFERTLLANLRTAVPSDTHTFWDMTIAAYWAWSVWDPQGGGFHSAQGSGGLGFAFPGAVAAAVGSGRRTFAVSGDGGALYSIAELASARQHDADVTWLIVDDGGYGILREYMTEAFGEATATELVRPDFVDLARSFGIPAERVNAATVSEAVAASFERRGPVVLVLPAVLRMFAPTHL